MQIHRRLQKIAPCEVNALIKANKQFDLLVMPGQDHPAGRRGPSAPYGDRTLWDFFVHNLLDSPTPNWNAVQTAPARGSSGDGLFGPTWDEIEAAWKAGR